MKPLSLVHDAAGRRFVATLAGGAPAGVLTYRPAESGVLELDYVDVPAELRGRGVAGAIVESVCRSLRAQGARVVPTCPYIVWWFRQHPEYQDLLTGGN